MLILSMLSLMASAKLSVFIDGSLKNVKYSLGNFGHVPYGRTLSGVIVQPLEKESQSLNWDLCNSSNLTPNANWTSYWVIAKSGNCSETTKAIAAQSIGAQLILIVSDQDNLTSRVQMMNDGMGFQVHIPAVLIGRKDGESIFNELATLMDAAPYGVISFSDSKQVEKPDVSLFLTLNDAGVFKFLRDFKPIWEQLKNHSNFAVTYQVTVSRSDSWSNFSNANADCMGGGRYCIDPWTVEGNGRQVIEEQLRQQCIWSINESSWFDYMEYFDKNCFKISAYEQCYQESNMTIKKSVDDCVTKSYREDSKKVKELWTNSLMDDWVYNKTNSGLKIYPGVLINNSPYKGNLEAEFVTDDICSNMLNQTICSVILATNDSNDSPGSNSQINWAMIAFAVVTCIVFGIFLFMCYRRRLKKQMQNELGQQVNEMVSQYIKFYETKNEA